MDEALPLICVREEPRSDVYFPAIPVRPASAQSEATEVKVTSCLTG